ncbi:hypothetical protein RRF57_012794 [Xylaria bambusicola]|uniref:Uncharacterized protein n=1 Tax=Xylaria bambusicola TaxID=326684 RepID=A0AAN7ZB63_9PEZI
MRPFISSNLVVIGTYQAPPSVSPSTKRHEQDNSCDSARDLVEYLFNQSKTSQIPMREITIWSVKLLLWLTLMPFVSVVAKQEAGQFFNPPDAIEGTHDYSDNPVYSLGSTVTIKFTTIYRNYAINLWQQTRGQNAATRGPSIFSTR